MVPAKKMKLSDEENDSVTTVDREVCDSGNLADLFLKIEFCLAAKVSALSYSPPISYVYNPIEYAQEVHCAFVHKFCNSPKEVMFLGMNPGPWGMSQTGVPFGEVNIVKEWMQLWGNVGRPQKENPMRPVLGFDCKRSEISGQRFWGLFKELSGDAANFFQHSFVYNHCPVAFMTESGKNITPAELPLNERRVVNSLTDETLCRVVNIFHVRTIVAIGRFAEKRALDSMKAGGIYSVKVVCIPHPSPRNFGTATKWKDLVTLKFEELGMMRFFCGRSNGMLQSSSHYSDAALNSSVYEGNKSAIA